MRDYKELYKELFLKFNDLEAKSIDQTQTIGQLKKENRMLERHKEYQLSKMRNSFEKLEHGYQLLLEEIAEMKQSEVL